MLGRGDEEEGRVGQELGREEPALGGDGVLQLLEVRTVCDGGEWVGDSSRRPAG